MASRWADDPAEIAAEAARKREKEAKKAAKAAAKAAQQRAAEEEAARRPKVVAGASPAAVQASDVNRTADADNDVDQSPRPTKRRRTSGNAPEDGRRLLHSEAPGWTRARTIEAYETLNHIEEGTYGSVSRGRERASGKIVAIKKMKMDDPNATGGFPITALREIETLNMVRGHKHIVELNEVVNGVGHDVGQVHLVMEFLEHDLKTLMDDMDEPWLPSETKTLMLQLGSALEFLHDHWILHVGYHTVAAMPSETNVRKARPQNFKHPHEQPWPDQNCRLWHGPIHLRPTSIQSYVTSRDALVSQPRIATRHTNLQRECRSLVTRLRIRRATCERADHAGQERGRPAGKDLCLVWHP